MIDLQIILVQYRDDERCWKLKHALDAAIASASLNWNTRIVDNSVINRGYGAAINLGVAESRSNYLLFLNADLEITVAQIQEMLRYLKANPGIGVLSPTFLNMDGSINPSGHEAPTPLKVLVAQSVFSRIFRRQASEFWMRDWDRRNTREVEVSNGACMMLPRAVFDQLGGFDPVFFLYWEEDDLCLRVRQAGYRVVHLASVRVRHAIGQTTMSSRDQQARSRAAFFQSRVRYLRKHFGLPGVSVHVLLRILEDWRVLIVVASSLILRLHHLDQVRVFGDMGRDALEALEILSARSFPLMGIPSSIPVLQQGPVQIYFSAVAQWIFGLGHLGTVVFSAVLTTLGLAVIYKVLERAYSPHVAVLSTMLWATFPMLVEQARAPYYLHLVQLTLPLALWSWQELDRRRDRAQAIGFGASLGLVFQSVLSTIPVVGAWALLAMIWYRRYPRVLFGMFLGLVVALLPQLLDLVRTGCSSLCLLPAWIGYRAVSQAVQSHGFLNTSWFESIWVLLSQHAGGVISASVLILLGTAGWLTQFFDAKHRSRFTVLLLSAVGIQALALFVHGAPSEAYLPPLLLPWLVLVGLAFRSSWYRTVLSIWIGAMFVFSFVKIPHASYTQHRNAVEEIKNAGHPLVHLVSPDPGAQFDTYLDFLEYLLILEQVQVDESGRTIEIQMSEKGVHVALD